MQISLCQRCQTFGALIDWRSNIVGKFPYHKNCCHNGNNNNQYCDDHSHYRLFIKIRNWRCNGNTPVAAVLDRSIRHNLLYPAVMVSAEPRLPVQHLFLQFCHGLQFGIRLSILDTVILNLYQLFILMRNDVAFTIQHISGTIGADIDRHHNIIQKIFFRHKVNRPYHLRTMDSIFPQRGCNPDFQGGLIFTDNRLCDKTTAQHSRLKIIGIRMALTCKNTDTFTVKNVTINQFIDFHPLINNGLFVFHACRITGKARRHS